MDKEAAILRRHLERIETGRAGGIGRASGSGSDLGTGATCGGGKLGRDQARAGAAVRYGPPVVCGRRRHVTPQTLREQVFALGKRPAPTAEALFQHALTHSVIGLDQTGWPKLEGEDGKPWQMCASRRRASCATRSATIKALIRSATWLASTAE